MSLTDVPKQLARRGLVCDCVAWYPWQLRGACPAVADPANTPALGLDSCAIFYIGGIVKVKLHYGLTSFNHLCSRERADDYAKDYAKLDEYADQNTPGQHWTAYRSLNQYSGESIFTAVSGWDLWEKLQDLLKPSTSVQMLEAINRRSSKSHCLFLKLKEKRMDCCYDGHMPNGGHRPLCVYINNTRARSIGAEQRRAVGEGQCRKGKSRKGTAGNGGKGKHAAVARGKGGNVAQSGKGKWSQK